jgi:hypothetical protein
MSSRGLAPGWHSLYPVAEPIPINPSMSNRNHYRLTMTWLTVTVRSVTAPQATLAWRCSQAVFAVSNYAGHVFTGPSGSSTLQRDRVPKGQWPTASMLNRPVNQDGCKSAPLNLVYHGTATKLSGGR